LATGRSAIAHLIARLPAGHGNSVLLPCYVAEGVIRPFHAAGWNILHYRLRADLSPVVGDVASLLSQASAPSVFVRIHYFGFPVVSPELDAVLKQHNTLVLDDLAHAPFAVNPDGQPVLQRAQVSLLSLNKFLPVTDGAILISNRADLDVSVDESALPELPPAALSAYEAHLRAARNLFQDSEVERAQSALQTLGESYEAYYAIINSDFRPHRQSAASLRLEQAFPVGELKERRARNTRILYNALENPTFSLVYPEARADVVPFCVPARVPAARREAIRAELFERGIVLSTLQDKWDFIPVDRRRHFAVESAYLDEHVLIPVSEYITAGAMQDMVAALNNV
jgi:dTDP-4-amino-4,6-dideoxygalactose transaminase